MSVVAVKVHNSGITIGADSIRVLHYTQTKDTDGKIRRLNGMVIGTAGNAEEAQLFFQFAATRRPKYTTEDGIADWMGEFHDWLRKKVGDNNKKLENYYLIVFEAELKAFYIEGYFVREVIDYYAIGAGMDYALAALYLGKGVKEALEAACELSIYCEKPLNIIEVSS